MPEPHRESPAVRAPEHGSTVVYRHEERGDEARYRLAVVVGPVVPEPATGNLWVGVRLPRPGRDNLTDLILVASIIDVQPPRTGETRYRS